MATIEIGDNIKAINRIDNSEIEGEVANKDGFHFSIKENSFTFLPISFIVEVNGNQVN